MADSGYPKKSEVIHASDVGETFVQVGDYVQHGGSWKLCTTKLKRRNDTTVDAFTYITGSLYSTAPSEAFVSVGAAKSSLQTLANEHHTHISSNFTELSGWSITESSDKSLTFSVG